jgi:chemotaxis response regulator CheB
MTPQDIIVIGTSLGGVEALKQIAEDERNRAVTPDGM